MPCYLSKLCTKDWRLLFPHTPSEKECASLCILLWIQQLWTKNLAIWVRNKYIINMGEKRRKNFPLVTLFVVRSTIPAIPKPTNKSLYVEVSTQQGYWWFSWPRDNFRRHWALWLLFIKFQKNQKNLMISKLCNNTDKLKYNIMMQFPCSFRHHHLLNKTDQQLCKILPGQILWWQQSRQLLCCCLHRQSNRKHLMPYFVNIDIQKVKDSSSEIWSHEREML